jgi:hypothetical protein
MAVSRTASLFALLTVLLHSSSALAQGLPLSSPDGRKQMTAARLTGTVTLDGDLSDEAWTAAAPATGFVQADPREGDAASEATEVRVLFDDEYLYIGAHCLDTDPSGIVINEIRKDFSGREQDTFEVLLDTFGDRRNGFVFATNAEGAKADTQIANEGRDVNINWDAVWWVAARKTADGWSAEFRIPFKTLRFQSGEGRLWGINFSRRVRRKNEISYWSPVSRAYTIYRASSEGDLTGLPSLQPGRNLRVKPFVLGRGVRPVGGDDFDRDAKAGVDVKLGVTPSLTLDVTINPDFAQAEADEQQVNLTQFSLFYPEKREFFLENSGIFYFGDIPRNTRSVTRFRPPEEDLLLFFSRRIGLTDGGEVDPLYGGLRLTGRVGRFGVGAMTMQSKSDDIGGGDNYTVLRVRRDMLASSDIGAIVLSRQPSGSRDDFNRVAGVDANFRFFRNLSINSFAARSDTPGVTKSQAAAKASIGWEDSRKRLQSSIMTIGDGFRDDLGFVRRIGVTRQFYDAAWFHRPAPSTRHNFRQFEPHGRIFLYDDPNGALVSKQGHAGMQVSWNNGSFFEYAFEPRTEAISKPFGIFPGVAIPAGRYDWNQHLFVVETDHSRAFSGSARLTLGEFWSGTQRTLQTSVLYRPNYRLVFDLGLQVSDIDLEIPREAFVSTLVNLRAGYSFTTSMFLDSLVQYRTDVSQFSANVRFNLIHRPLSDFFIVYNESQFTDTTQTPGRGLIVKFTQMLAF